MEGFTKKFVQILADLLNLSFNMAIALMRLCREDIDTGANFGLDNVIKSLDGELHILEADKIRTVVDMESGWQSISSTVTEEGQDHFLGFQGFNG